jgi:hypothetical protein
MLIPLNPYQLHLIKADNVPATVIKTGRPRRLMCRDLLGNLQTASILEVRGNPRRSEGVVCVFVWMPAAFARLRIIR